MSRVERTETADRQRRSEQSRQAKADPMPSQTPGKAEGEQRDIEQALKNQKE
ncbi:MAG TPA: hypothetical protein VF215_00665 [Thermoanaerobaculia bacterium]